MRSKKERVEFLEELEKSLKEHQRTNWLRDMMGQCLEIIAQLEDENESVWGMLDEMKESEMETWAKNNENVLQDYVDEHIKELKWFNKMKGDA